MTFEDHKGSRYVCLVNDVRRDKKKGTGGSKIGMARVKRSERMGMEQRDWE